MNCLTCCMNPTHNLMKRLIYLLFFALLLLPLTAVRAQENSLTLRLSRDFGYGSRAQIRGTFSYRVSGPEDLVRVVFLLDGEPIGEDMEAPFRLQFRTENFPLGSHTLSAVGYTSSGAELQSNSIQRNFVSSEESTNFLLWVIVPIVVLALGGRFLASRIANRNGRNSGQPAISGALGGTICPHCGRPYAIHLWSVNLMMTRLDRCPHCGKWKLVRRMPQEMLEAAAAAWEEGESTTTPAPAAKKTLSDQLDESRYDDL